MRDREQNDSSRDARWLLHDISQVGIALTGYGLRRATRPCHCGKLTARPKRPAMPLAMNDSTEPLVPCH